jgi:putative aldouronate transport system permease protein
VFVTVAGTGIGLLLNATMGYVLSRPGFRLRRFYTMLIFIPMLFGGGMVASYMINTQMLMLRNTYWALLLPVAVSSFYIIILRTFFQTTVPDSLIESAKIDGALQTRIFFQIVLPISLPALATIGLFLSFRYWNEWFCAMLYIQSDHTQMYPLQYVLISLQRNFEFLTRNAQYMGADASVSRLPAEAMRMALVIVVVLPIACSYPFFQKYFISGLTIGAVKG